MERRDRYFALNGDCQSRAVSGKLIGGGKIVRGMCSRTSTEDVIKDPDWYKH